MKIGIGLGADDSDRSLSAALDLQHQAAKVTQQMKSSKMTTVVGVAMILGSIPCTLAGALIAYLFAALDEGRAAGRDVGFDVIGIVMMMFFAYLLALGSCIAGLLYFGHAVRNSKVTLKAWHWFGIVYSLSQVTVATIYMSAR